jgi:hypothetical protein
MKEINMLGSLSSAGGGEQSLCDIANAFRRAGWKVNLYPWASVSPKHKDTEVLEKYDFSSGRIYSHMKSDLPLFFYGNDQIYSFVKEEKTRELIDKCSSLCVGINFTNGGIVNVDWMADKFRGALFLNREKERDFLNRRSHSLRNVRTRTMTPPVDISKFDAPLNPRTPGTPFIVLKHCRADIRKFVVERNKDGGDAPHLWQKHCPKITDAVLYRRLLARYPNIVFEFMHAPAAVKKEFEGVDRMVFREFDSMPVPDYLSRGHLYFYRLSNHCRDQGPRAIVEAQAAGLPVITENRDGPADRIIHGDTGFFALDHLDVERWIDKLYQNEEYRFDMAREARKHMCLSASVDNWVDEMATIFNQ